MPIPVLSCRFCCYGIRDEFIPARTTDSEIKSDCILAQKTHEENPGHIHKKVAVMHMLFAPAATHGAAAVMIAKQVNKGKPRQSFQLRYVNDNTFWLAHLQCQKQRIYDKGLYH